MSDNPYADYPRAPGFVRAEVRFCPWCGTQLSTPPVYTPEAAP